jgi:hypothetical protein
MGAEGEFMEDAIYAGARRDVDGEAAAGISFLGMDLGAAVAVAEELVVAVIGARETAFIAGA